MLPRYNGETSIPPRSRWDRIVCFIGDYYGWFVFTFIVIALSVVLCLLVDATSATCPNCGEHCQANDNYCHACGKMLRYTNDKR